ncbi:hypothetical protein [Paludisphaera soli]|uniref:hypothetical protein n=1 Tax=Paludisphaera soli TaxID=2712865 RepID=UPI0013EC452D|nr:hypothetical protein [Paludisphaera soli]
MAKLRPDFSFEREGRPLSAWLMDLVADDPRSRLRAGDVLYGMWFGVPYAHTDLADLDWDEYGRNPGQNERFGRAVREAVAGRDFPLAGFARRLIIADLAKQHEWRRFRRKSRERAAAERDEVAEAIVRRLADAGDAPDRRAENRRLAVALCPSLDGRDDVEAIHQADFAVHLVVGAVDAALLVDRPALRAWRNLDVLRRIGPPAIEFAPSLIDDLDACGESHGFKGAAALGSIGRDDPAVVAALLGRLRSGTAPLQFHVAACLYHAGPALAGRLDEAVELLIELTRSDEGPSYHVTEALGSVGRGREDALGRLLEMASCKPPRWIADPSGPDGRSDGTMYERGQGLTALRFFPRFASHVVPVLIEAMDSFEEYDPDWTYNGAYGRICHTLAALGPEGAAAVPRLVAYLEGYLRQLQNGREDNDDWPKAVFRALAGIGPTAAAALPVLEALRCDREAENGSGEPSPLDRSDDLDGAILAIRG